MIFQGEFLPGESIVTRAWATIFVVFLGGQETPDQARKDLDAFQGEWALHAMEANGKEVNVAQLQGTVLTVQGDAYRIKVKDRKLPTMIIKLNPMKDPKEIDMVATDGDKKDQVHKGIYSVDKTTIKICRGLNAEQARPREFGSWPDTNIFVVTWKRVK